MIMFDLWEAMSVSFMQQFIIKEVLHTSCLWSNSSPTMNILDASVLQDSRTMFSSK